MSSLCILYPPLAVVLSRLELLTPTLSVWCSNQLSYRTVYIEQTLQTRISEPRSAKDLRQLNYFRKEVFLVNLETSSRSFSSERRCSSRTFRYGYLVTT